MVKHIMSGVPYSSNETDADVGARPATWYDGTPITSTVWDNIIAQDNLLVNGHIGSRPANKSDTIWGILSADDGQGSAGKALIVDNTGAIANIQGIGINTTTPTERLHIVNGNIKTTGGTITAEGNITTSGNVIATNIKNYYQTVNSANSTVGDSGSSTQITNAGCPSTASDWTRYLSWKTSGDDTINSNSNVFSPQNYGLKALVAGTYKITVNMAFQAEGQNQSIVIRLAKNTLNDEVADSNQENPGPLAGTGYQPGFTGANTGKVNSFGAASITHIMTLAVNDEVSVYTTNVGQVHGSGVNSHTREGYSQLLVEYLG